MRKTFNSISYVIKLSHWGLFRRTSSTGKVLIANLLQCRLNAVINHSGLAVWELGWLGVVEIKFLQLSGGDKNVSRIDFASSARMWWMIKFFLPESRSESSSRSRKHRPEILTIWKYDFPRQHEIFSSSIIAHIVCFDESIFAINIASNAMSDGDEWRTLIDNLLHGQSG